MSTFKGWIQEFTIIHSLLTSRFYSKAKVKVESSSFPTELRPLTTQKKKTTQRPFFETPHGLFTIHRAVGILYGQVSFQI